MQDTLWFGKHKGKDYREVMREHPTYALWAHQNVAGFCLSPAEIQSCVAASDIGPRAGRTDPRWMEDDEDDKPDYYGGMSYADFGNN